MSNFAPTFDQVLGILKHQARAIAEKLGHRWTGLEINVHPGEWGTFCSNCLVDCVITPRSFNKPTLRGEMVTFACKSPSHSAGSGSTCRHCGNRFSGSMKLCPSPGRMGPCE